MKAHITNIFAEKKCNATCKYADTCPLASRCEFQEYSEKCDSKLYTHRRHGKNRRKHREFRHKRLLDMLMETFESVLKECSKGTIFDPEHPDHDKPFYTKFVDFKTGGIMTDEAIRDTYLEILEECSGKENEKSERDT